MLRKVESSAWILAAVLMFGSASVGVADYVSQQQRLVAFNAVAAERRSDGQLTVATPDQSEWSSLRTRRYQELRSSRSGTPEAVLRIPALGVEAEIFGNTGDRALDLGVGHIEGTAQLGAAGNIGLAGHRDGYFRRLKDIRPSQTIEIATPGRTWKYRVIRTEIVDPEDVGVLAPTASPALTLVTCYPFYFMGNAPQRFIVHARLVT